MSLEADLFGNLVLTRPVPKTEEDWLQLQLQAEDVFSPHAPIDDQTLFAGRTDIVRRVITTVFQRGRHAILYGERGVGKTSLANILKDQIFSKSQVVKVVKRNCTQAHNFRLMWVHALDEYTVDGKASSEFLGPDPNPYDIYRVLESLPPMERPVFIFDEFDRISDENCFATMADTIKYLADYSSKSTVIIVGVADNVSELFGGHPSVQRNVQQIRMPRMSQDELRAIFNRRMPLLGMHFHPKVMDLIIELSQGLPTYTHLLGQNAALAAIGRKSLEVTASDFNACIEVCISEADETVREGYLKAVRSTKPGNQYRQALLACAMAKTNEKGYFNAADVRPPFSKIMNRDVDIPHFARHLKEFCDDDRGPALVKTGKARSYEYRFVDPLLRPYVILRGISDKMIEP